jgi:type I restriction enzyme S subunit
MNKYQSYKSSGVEWIGDIPIDWGVSKLKYLTTKDVQYGINSSSDNYVDTGIRFIRTTDILESGGLIDDGVYVEESLIPERQITELYDFLISRSGTLGRTYLHLNSEKYTYGGYLVRFNFGSESLSKFIDYYCKSNSFSSWISLNTIVSTIGNVNGQKYSNMEIPLPPLNYINHIVKFLDEKTELIDKFISTKERKITLLKEQRTSLINQIVTKGLNPNVKMKDSGSEWIGEIPEHWSVGKLKHICKENLKSLSNNTNPEYQLNYIEISDVNSDGVIENSTHYSFSESPSRCRRIVSRGDIILSTVRTYLRSIGIIENEVSDLICSTGFSVLTPNRGVVPRHLFYMVRTEWFISMVISKSEGVSYPSIQSDKLMSNLILIVPENEQHQIVEYLDSKTKEIDDLVDLEQKKIDLLKEYRQSLISEVVTGKIKVTTDE